MGFPDVIETERLILRRWREEDREGFEQIWADREVFAALRPGVPFDPSFGALRFPYQLRHWEEHGFGRLAVRQRESDEIVGLIGPAHPKFAPEMADEVEIGWMLRRPFWGKGLASEGAAAAAAAAFSHLAVDHVVSLINTDDVRSIRVAEKLGMRTNGRTLPDDDGASTLRVYVLTPSP